ncbi:MAG: PilZ domain-containing protein [Candidatus Acidiferrum sp.]
MPPLTLELSAAQARQLEERWAKMRSHKRAVASRRFLVEWEEGQQRRCANGITVDVSDSGCMAVVGADLPLRRQVRLVLPETGRSTQGEVVWRGHEAWDIGIAFAEPDASFWNRKA